MLVRRHWIDLVPNAALFLLGISLFVVGFLMPIFSLTIPEPARPVVLVLLFASVGVALFVGVREIYRDFAVAERRRRQSWEFA